MRWVWLLLGFACAPTFTCGSGFRVRVPDAGDGPRYPQPPDGFCDPLTQVGCRSGEKCTWIIDQADSSSSTGHIGCAPAGTMAAGAACTRNPPGATGYDDCITGGYCDGPAVGGTGSCEAICDVYGGAPKCGNGLACTREEGVFGPPGMTVAAGLCVAACDPLADNNFLGSAGNNRTGSSCGSGGIASGSGFIYRDGCYGGPGPGSAGTPWACMPQLNPTRVHRAACDTFVHAGDSQVCSPDGKGGYVNGCASGYEPMYADNEGTSYVDCVALCRPASCYDAGSGSSSCGTGSDVNITGTAPYQCNSQRLQYAAFDTTDPTAPWSSLTPMVNNGEQCLYSWVFEVDGSGTFTPSATSDTVGYCFDHAHYTYDPTGGSNATTTWPRCDYIGLGSGAQPYDAAAFGCVDSATARAAGDITFAGKVTFPRPPLRLPYHR